MEGHDLLAWCMFLPLCSCGGDGKSISSTDTDGASGTQSTTDPPTSSGVTDGGSTDGSTDGSTSGGTTSSETTGGAPGCDPIETFEIGTSPTTEIHVAVSGNDVADCGAAANPCATIDHAATLAGPGTAVVVHEGTYAADAYIENLAGTVDQPIWIGGAAGEQRPVIDGGGQALHFVRVRYLVVHDLEVVGATANGINMDDGAQYDDPDATRYVVFRGLSFHDIGAGGNQDCLKLSGVNDFWVLDSSFERCGAGGSGIDHVGCHDGLIAGNSFVDVGSNGVQAKGGSEGIEIRGNVFVDAGARGINLGGSTGFEFFRPPLSMAEPNAEARDIRVVANVIVGGDTPLAFVGCDGCLAANNTIVNPGRWLFRILQETPTSGSYPFVPARQGTFQNNLVYFDRSTLSTWVNIGADTDPASFSFVTNLWYAHDEPSQSDPAADLPTAEVGGLYGMDPLLTDVAGGDVSIPGESPAAGAGTTHGSVKVDRSGNCYADPPSIGAFEVPR